MGTVEHTEQSGLAVGQIFDRIYVCALHGKRNHPLEQALRVTVVQRQARNDRQTSIGLAHDTSEVVMSRGFSLKALMFFFTHLTKARRWSSNPVLAEVKVARAMRLNRPSL